MAIRGVTEGVSNWNSKMFFPKDRYSITCIEEEFKKSDGGNPMLIRTWEIKHPETIQLGDKTVNIGGTKVTQYVVTKVSDGEGGWDTQKSDKAFGRFRDELLSVGFSDPEIDDENPPVFMKGKTVEAVLYGKKSQSFKDPTPEQRAAGKRIGDPIKDVDGKDIVIYQIQIESILGLSEHQVAVPY